MIFANEFLGIILISIVDDLEIHPKNAFGISIFYELCAGSNFEFVLICNTIGVFSKYSVQSFVKISVNSLAKNIVRTNL